MDSYQPAQLEPKWQTRWQKAQLYRADLKRPGAKYYAFGMFNYPSAEGIHVGHVKNFTLPDVLVRIKRQQGAVVYSPVGFDSFGLPTENHALKTGTPPREITDQVLANYRRQYQALGLSCDWSREIDTSQVDYYRWTQWVFLQLYHQGLVYQAAGQQWWCDSCQTVLAEAQVIGGRCWRQDGPEDPLIGKKSLRQWFFKITAYADELLAATADLDWTDWVKTAQVSHIGRSEGLSVKFPLEGLDLDQELEVFTTAVDTIYGATFVVLAPEHPLVELIIERAGNGPALADYVARAVRQTEVDRQQAKHKTGLAVDGLVARHPITKAVLPVWVADYVLAGYGTGAIMAVPGADYRDFEFAEQHGLAINYPTDTGQFVAYTDISRQPTRFRLVIPDPAADPAGSSLQGQTMAAAKAALTQRLVAQGRAQSRVNYRLRDWLVSRQRYWGAPIPIIHCPDCGPQPVPERDLPVELPPIDDYRPAGDGRSPLARAKDWLRAPCPKCGQPGERECDTMDGYVCSSWYHLRYLAANNGDQAWDPATANRWLPVDFYNGADHAIAHLLYVRFITRFFADQGLLSHREPFQRFYMHAKIMAPDGQPMSKSKGTGVDPLQIIDQGYGADALRLYICFMAPPNIKTSWNDNGVAGAFRFLQRCFSLVVDWLEQRPARPTGPPGPDLVHARAKCLRHYEQSVARLKLNTAVAALMDFVNQLYRHRGADEQRHYDDPDWPVAIDTLVCLLAPFAPHLASELWERLGHKGSVHVDNWPAMPTDVPPVAQITIGVTVNGKRRGELVLTDPATDQAEVVERACEIPTVARRLAGRPPRQVNYVPGRVLNLTIDPPASSGVPDEGLDSTVK